MSNLCVSVSIIPKSLPVQKVFYSALCGAYPFTGLLLNPVQYRSFIHTISYLYFMLSTCRRDDPVIMKDAIIRDSKYYFKNQLIIRALADRADHKM